MLNPKNLKNGKEQYESYHSPLAGGKRVQYDYRHINGQLFSTVKKTLAACRAAKIQWLAKLK